jgi:hypothetical protein
MLGHASITLTVDTYGKWLPMKNNAGVGSPRRSVDPAIWWQEPPKPQSGRRKSLM